MGPKHLRNANVLSCIFKTSFGILQSYWPPHARAPPVALLLLLLLATVAVPYRDPPDVVSTRVAMTVKTHVRQCDPCPPTGTMPRLGKSVLFCRICCTMLFRSSSSCHTGFEALLYFHPHALRLSLFNNSDQSPAFLSSGTE